VTSTLYIPAGSFTRSYTTLPEPPTGDGDFEFSNGWTFEYTGIDLGPSPGGFADLIVNSDEGEEISLQLTLDENEGPALAEYFNIAGDDEFIVAPDANLLKCSSSEPYCLEGVRNLRVRAGQPCAPGGMCGGGNDPTRTLRSLELRPDGTFDPEFTALFTTQQPSVNAYASVRDPASGANPNIVGGWVRLHPGTHTGNVTSVGSFEAYWGTQVHGWVRTGFEESTRIDADVLMQGGIDRGRAVAVPDLSGWRTFSPWYQLKGQATPSNHINSEDWTELEPGHYGTFTLNSQATAVFKEGTYYFVAFTANDSARMELPLEGGVTIHVLNSLTMRGKIVENPAWNQDDPGQHGNLRIIYHGVQEVHVGNTPFVGTIVAPNAKITLNTTNPQGQGALPNFPNQPGHHGAFYAQSIELHQGTPLWFYPYRPWRNP
jgi:hypothetical protein